MTAPVRASGPPSANRAACWGCGRPAPFAANAVALAGWQARETTATAPGQGGFKPRTYRVRETVCPECFAAAGGWYDPPAAALPRGHR